MPTFRTITPLSLIATASAAASTTQPPTSINGVLVVPEEGAIRITATDGTVLVEYRYRDIPEELARWQPPHAVILDGDAMPTLVRWHRSVERKPALLSLTWDETQLRLFSSMDGSGITVRYREGEYPHYEHILEDTDEPGLLTHSCFNPCKLALLEHLLGKGAIQGFTRSYGKGASQGPVFRPCVHHHQYDAQVLLMPVGGQVKARNYRDEYFKVLEPAMVG